MYTLKELKRKKTLSTGQQDDLKIDDGNRRVWLSRGDVANGEPYPNKVTIEIRRDDRWIIDSTYQAE